MELRQILDVLAALEAEGVHYAVFGGLAMAAHGLDRATRDLDLFVDPDEANVEALRRALRSVFDDDEIELISASDLAGEYPAVQYGPPRVDYTIDIVARLGDAFAFDDLEIQRVEAEGVEIAVVTPRTLFEMKRDTVRPRDRDDAERLRRRFDLGTSAHARPSLPVGRGAARASRAALRPGVAPCRREEARGAELRRDDRGDGARERPPGPHLQPR